jgi:hypothetical protein
MQFSFKFAGINKDFEAKLIAKSLVENICMVDFYISCSAWSKTRYFMTADFNLPYAILKNVEVRRA